MTQENNFFFRTRECYGKLEKSLSFSIFFSKKKRNQRFKITTPLYNLCLYRRGDLRVSWADEFTCAIYLVIKPELRKLFTKRGHLPILVFHFLIRSHAKDEGQQKIIKKFFYLVSFRSSIFPFFFYIYIYHSFNETCEKITVKSSCVQCRNEN